MEVTHPSTNSPSTNSIQTYPGYYVHPLSILLGFLCFPSLTIMHNKQNKNPGIFKISSEALVNIPGVMWHSTCMNEYVTCECAMTTTCVCLACILIIV